MVLLKQLIKISILYNMSERDIFYHSSHDETGNAKVAFVGIVVTIIFLTIIVDVFLINRSTSPITYESEVIGEIISLKNIVSVEGDVKGVFLFIEGTYDSNVEYYNYMLETSKGIIKMKDLVSDIYIEEDDNKIPQKVRVYEISEHKNRLWENKKKKFSYDKLIIPEGSIVREIKID